MSCLLQANHLNFFLYKKTGALQTTLTQVFIFCCFGGVFVFIDAMKHHSYMFHAYWKSVLCWQSDTHIIVLLYRYISGQNNLKNCLEYYLYMFCCEMLFQFTGMFEITYNDAQRNYIALIHNQDNYIPLNVQISYLCWLNKVVLLEQKQGLLKSQKPKQGVEMVWTCGRDLCFTNCFIRVLWGLSRYLKSGRKVSCVK